MSIDLDSVDGFDRDRQSCFEPAPLLRDGRFTMLVPNQTATKTMASFSNSMQKEGGGSVSGGIGYEWGSTNGKFSAWAKAEAHDRNGNQIEAKAEQRSDGSGRIDFSGSCQYKESPYYQNHNNQDRG